MTETPRAAKRTGRQSCQSCALFVAGLGALFLFYFVYCLRAPMWNAERLKARLHPGMTAGEVVAASLGTGRHLVLVSPSLESAHWSLGESGVTVGDQNVSDPAAVRALVDKNAAALAGHTLLFVYVTNVPVRARLSVTLDGEARVSAITGPVGHAD